MYFFNFNLIKFLIIYKRIEYETNTHYYPKINIDNDIFLKRYFNSSRRSLNTFDKQLKSKNRKILGQKMFQIQHPKIRARCLTHAFENEASIQPQNRNVLTLLRSVLQHFSCTSLNSHRMDTEYYRITPPAPSGILVKPLVEPLETLSHACECTRNKLREALKRDAPGEFEVRTRRFFRARSTNLPRW